MKKHIRVVAAVIIRGGKVLIGRRMDSDSFGGQWEFPGGKVDSGESDREALKREIREELEVEIGVGDVLGQISHDYEEISIDLFFFSCEVREDVGIASNAHQELRWVSKTELAEIDFLEADLPFVARLTTLM